MADPKQLAKILGMMAPTPRPSLPEDALNPGQMNGLQYSRDRYNDGSYQVNSSPGPSVTSFMGAISQAPDGSYVNYPTFWNGKVMDPKTALGLALQYEQTTGKKFARYPDVPTAEAGEQKVHGIMEGDATKILAWPETQKRLKGGR